MKHLAAFLLTLFMSCQTFAQSNEACLSWAVWKEARGEGILTQRAVLTVIENRMRASGHSACGVLRAYGQFPYMSDGVGQVSKEWLTRMKFLAKLPSVVSNRTYYFNETPFRFGKKPLKIGNLFFN